MKSFKQLRIEREQQARSDALNRFIQGESGTNADLRAQLAASSFSFVLTILILCAATYGIVKTGGLR